MENNEPLNKNTWEEFRSSGMLWWINMILHTFGWAIVTEVEDNTGKVVNVFPSRVKCRGFDNEVNTQGYIKVSNYLKDNIEEILEESKS